jgi:hypothetical protein
MYRNESFKLFLARYLPRAFLPVLLLIGGVANAGNFYLSADLGIADPRQSSFDRSTSYRLAGGYRFEKLGLEVSAMDLDSMDYQDLFNSYIEIKGVSAHIYIHHKFNNVLGMEMGAGLFDWNADATLLGFDAGEDSDTSGYYDIRLLTEFNDTVAAYAATRYLPDISGTDVVTFSIGMTINF